MESWLAALSILGAVTIGAISPGPSFVVVARTAIAVSRLAGLAMALGMGLGGVIFAGAALLGLHLVLTTVPWLHLGLRLAGGAYLLYLAYRLWQGAGDPPPEAAPSADRAGGLRRSLLIGLATQISNPKTAIVYASIFTVLLPADSPSWLAAFILPSIFAIETGWYALVALAFSADAPRRGYLRAKPWIDRAAGGVMGVLGVKLIADAR